MNGCFCREAVPVSRSISVRHLTRPVPMARCKNPFHNPANDLYDREITNGIG